MKTLRKYSSLYLLIFIVAGCASAPTTDDNSDMAAAEKAKLESEALAGSPEAAQSLMSYYSLKRPNTQEAMYWAHIEAENGSAVGMYNYGFYLSKDADPRNQARAKFWLEQADKNGAPLAENLLKQMEAKQ